MNTVVIGKLALLVLLSCWLGACGQSLEPPAELDEQARQALLARIDRIGDEASGKKTLAVRIGDSKTRVLYIACLTFGVLVGIFVSPLAILAIPFVRRPSQIVSKGAVGRDLIAVLMKTSTVQIVGGLGLAIGLLFR